MSYPADILGITGPNSIWKLQYGLPGRKGLLEAAPAKLGMFELDPEFTVTDDGDWVQVRVGVNAGTSSGSSYPRVELRQMTAAGREAAWNSKTLDCWFEYELQITHLPPNKPQMCLLQLHDDEYDLLEVIYQRNASAGYEFTQRVAGSSKGQPLIPHALYKSCVLALGLVKGVPTVYLDGKAVLTTTKMPQSSVTYAKALAYLQSNTKYDRADEYGQILARNVRTGTGKYPGPPAPGTQPPPVEQDPPLPIDPAGWTRFLEWLKAKLRG